MQNTNNTWLVAITISLLVILVGLIILMYVQLTGGNPFSSEVLALEDNPREALGWTGDFFGGVLNPVLAFLSFVGLLYTLKLNQEELNETRQELKRAADAQQESQKLRNEQLTTQFLQQFDSFFSMLLNQLHHKIEAIRQDRVLDELHQNMEKELDKDEIWYVQELKNLFNFIYLTLDSVASNIVLNNTFDTEQQMRLKDKYWSIIRSMIPEKVMHLMMKDCIDYAHDPKIKRHKPLIEQADFFENISFYGLSPNQKFWLIWASSKFDPQIFGENYGYAQIKETLPFKLIAETNVEDLESFVFQILQQSSLIQPQQQNLKCIEVDLKNEIRLSFDYTNNSKNPELSYLDEQLEEIEILEDRIQLGFRNSENPQQQTYISFVLKQQNTQIVINDVQKIEKSIN